jgi:hypothetical protein
VWAQQPGKDVGAERPHLRAAQSRLAEELTSLVHGRHQAAQVGRHARPLARSWLVQQWAGRWTVRRTRCLDHGEGRAARRAMATLEARRTPRREQRRPSTALR